MDPREKSMKFLRKIVLFGDAMKFTPYGWPSFESSVQYHTTIHRKRWQISLLTGLISYIFFLAIQCHRVLTDPEADRREQMGVIYITSGYFLVSISHYPQIFVSRDYVQLVNRFRAFMALQGRQQGKVSSMCREISHR